MLSSKDILKTLVELLEAQEEIKITYETEEALNETLPSSV